MIRNKRIAAEIMLVPSLAKINYFKNANSALGKTAVSP